MSFEGVDGTFEYVATMDIEGYQLVCGCPDAVTVLLCLEGLDVGSSSSVVGQGRRRNRCER